MASEVKGGISLKPGRTPGPYFVRLLVDEATGGISLRVMARDAMGEGSRTSPAYGIVGGFAGLTRDLIAAKRGAARRAWRAVRACPACRWPPSGRRARR
jgi:hypothetical protein